MPHQASTDRELGRAGASQRQKGLRLLLLGGILLGLGLLFMSLGQTDLLDFTGVALAALAAVPTLAGLALLLSGLVSGRASRRKPFA